MEITLIYPHQLYRKHPAVTQDKTIYFIEEPLVYGCDSEWPVRHHARRQALLKQAGKFFTKQLEDDGFDVEVVDLLGSLNQGCASSKDLLNRLPGMIEKIHLAEVVDDLVSRRLEEWCTAKGIDLVWYRSPNFLSPESWWREHFEGRKKPFMAHFYKAQRKRLGILVDDEGKPQGGKWSYDEDNRKKLPKDFEEPSLPECDSFDDQVVDWVDEVFPDAWGEADAGLPLTHEEADEWLEAFLAERFSLFGDYEDAISDQHSTVHHSLLTPMLNIGLLEPKQVVDRALEYADSHDVPMNSLEGFVRQIIGWREFMRCMYELHGREMRMKNFWGFTNEMPKCFYTGRSGLPAVDTVIKEVLKTGYCHHIERLMVLGVIFQLCHVKPTAVYQWFMEMFIDAYDWVMVPNVYGMSQFADGGHFVTKPYVCGSNYIRKMSNYSKGDWCDVWDGLFWDFIAANRDFYNNQPRLGMMTRQLDKMDSKKLEAHRERAEEFRKKIHNGWQCEDESSD